MLFDLILFSIIVMLKVIQAQDDYGHSPKCPFVNPVCKCPLQELCKNDGQCPKGEKCCLDCCGGHRCTIPVHPRCTKPHEVYNSCGSHCPPTCANRKPGPCILSCNPGCFCEQGYLRNNKGDCVKENNCDGYSITTK